VSEKPQNPLRELRRGVWPVQDQETEQHRREHIAGRIVTLNRQLAEGSLRRRRQGAWLALAALVGSVCVLWVFFRTPDNLRVAVAPEGVRLVSGAASLSRGGVLAPLDASPLDGSLGEPILVTRADQSAEFRLSSATALKLEAASEVGLERRETPRGFEERVRLRTGAVALRVPKLGERGKILVETSDSSIEVHGTQFSVRWVERPPLASFTLVQVKEGKVLVRSKDGTSRFLITGEEWRSGAEIPPVVAPEATPEVPPPAPPAVKAASAPLPKPKAAAASAPEPSVAVSASDLAAQNRLLEGAELARKSGMPALALERLDTLMQRYPDAELAHNARVQRFRLLWSMGRKAQAQSGARDYLERYPHGFARKEAEAYVDATTTGEALRP
jgi:ferric-dicitrate binding protein FerR (iron transport regulator)